MTRRHDVTHEARFAGQVERYHTWPTHRRQSVGEHTWQVMRIWLEIFGAMSPEESRYLVWHDAAEVAVGDPPFPVKARSPALKKAYARLEWEAMMQINAEGAGVLDRADDELRLKAKVCDLLEMWEFGICEYAMGNLAAEPIITDTGAAVRDLIEKLPDGAARTIEGHMMRLRRRWGPPQEWER